MGDMCHYRILKSYSYSTLFKHAMTIGMGSIRNVTHSDPVPLNESGCSTAALIIILIF